MSAYICDREHIIYLVQAAQSRRISSGTFRWCHGNPLDWKALPGSDYETAADVANMLLLENIKSVGTRYPHESSATLPGDNDQAPFTSQDLARIYWLHFDPVQVIKSAHCYAYQACESADWEKSEAFAFIESLKGSAMHALTGYDAAEWGAPAVYSNAKNVVKLTDLIARKR